VKLLVDIQGDIRAMMLAEVEAAERAVTAGVYEAASGLQQDWRGQITGAALGRGLANSIRKKMYPTTNPTPSRSPGSQRLVCLARAGLRASRPACSACRP